MMIQQPAFRIDEIQIASVYTEHEREAILAILQQASKECKLISRVCTVAANRKLPLPKTPEALMSFMLYETQEQEGVARSFHETLTHNEQTLDLQATSCLAEIWEYIALLRKFVNLLYALKEGAQKHAHSFGFVLKGSIGMTHERYAEAYHRAVEAMDQLIEGIEGEASTIEGVSYALVIDRTIALE
jgi:hypothetical protein